MSGFGACMCLNALALAFLFFVFDAVCTLDVTAIVQIPNASVLLVLFFSYFYVLMLLFFFIGNGWLDDDSWLRGRRRWKRWRCRLPGHRDGSGRRCGGNRRFRRWRHCIAGIVHVPGMRRRWMHMRPWMLWYNCSNSRSHADIIADDTPLLRGGCFACRSARLGRRRQARAIHPSASRKRLLHT